MSRFVELPASAGGSDLARGFQEATHGLIVTAVTLTVSRERDGFLLALVSHGPRSPDETRRRIGVLEVRGIEPDQVAVAVTWARGALRNVDVRAHLVDWSGAPLESRAAEVRRLFPGALPALVEVSRGVPVTERGEEPTGHASVRLRLAYSAPDPTGSPETVPLTVEIDGVYTDETNHAAVGGELAERGDALAQILGVPCNVTS